VKRVTAWLIPLVILLLGAGVLTALKATRPETTPLESAERAWVVDAVRARPQTRTPALLLYGQVESPRVARLTAAVTADVESVYVLEGERVAAGQPLVALDDRERLLLLRQREADVAEIEARIASERERHRNDLRALEHEQRLVALGRRAVERAGDLAEREVGSQAQVDQAREELERRILALEARRLAIRGHTSRLQEHEAELERARALLEQARLDVRRTQVRAPFAGAVAAVEVSPGDRAREGDPLLEVYDRGMLELRAQIPTRHLPAVQRGLARGLELRAGARIDGHSVEATLDRLASRVERGSGGVDAFFRVRDGGEWLQLGRTVELVLELPPVHDAVALPFEALYGRERVFKLEGDRLSAVTVERLGETRTAGGEARLLVRSPDLQSGDRVLATQLPNAIDGLKVKVASAGQAGAGEQAQGSP